MIDRFFEWWFCGLPRATWKAIKRVIYLVIAAPIALVGYLAHKIIVLVSVSFLAGWFASRDCESNFFEDL